MIDYNATLSQVVHDYVINLIFLFRKNLSSSTAGRNIKIVARIAVNSINCHLLLPSLAMHYYIVCDRCFEAIPFYTIPQISTLSETDCKIKFGHNILQILGGGLVGIGKSGLDFVNSFMELPSTLANRAFYKAQAYLSKVSTEIAQQSCMWAALELRDNIIPQIRTF